MVLFLSWSWIHAQGGVEYALHKIKINNIQPIEKIKYLNQLAAHYLSDSTNLSLSYASEAYLLALKNDAKLWQARSLINLAEGYLYNDNYDQALNYAFTALDISTRQKSKADIATCNTTLGWIFYDSENAEFAMQYHRKAKELLLQLKEIKKAGVASNAMGLTFYAKGQIDSAQVYFEEALRIAQQTQNHPGESSALNNLGICFSVKKNYPQALAFFEQSLALKKNSNDLLRQAETLNQMANALLELKNYPKTELYLQQSWALIDQSTSNAKKENMLDNLGIKAKLYEQQQRIPEAYRALRQYLEVKNEINSQFRRESIATLKLKRETQENEARINHLAAQKELRSFQRNMLSLVLVLLIIIGLLLYNRIRQKQKKQKELNSVQQKLMEKELENVVLERNALSSKLEYKNAELKNSALYIAQRNELTRQLIDELNTFREDVHKESQNKFRQFLNKIQYKLELNEDVQAFNLAADEIHKDFIYNLIQAFPDLSENELRLCSQIRLNLSNKDVASLNNISIKAVEMARYRLRKHFNLKHEDNLHDFLGRF